MYRTRFKVYAGLMFVCMIVVGVVSVNPPMYKGEQDNSFLAVFLVLSLLFFGLTWLYAPTRNGEIPRSDSNAPEDDTL